MSLPATVVHNPGITYSNKKINGFVDVLIAVEIDKTTRDIINRTANNKYVFGQIVAADDKMEVPKLKYNNIDFIISFEDLKNNIDVSGKLNIFTCSFKESVLLYNNLSGDFTIGVFVALGEAVYRYEDALDQVKERGTLHSVFIQLQK